MQATTSTDSTALRFARLPDRGIVRVAGPDAAHLLQGLLTQDLDLLASQPAIYAGLLAPQGKILFDFLVLKSGEDVLLDCPRDRAADLIKRLTLYRLRAKVVFSDVSDELCVVVAWGGTTAPNAPAGGVAAPDPRLAALGWRIILPAAEADAWMARAGSIATPDDWHAHRVSLGVPQGGLDFAYNDAFPHEADMDQLSGVSFDKGCYVGQEVVSRMQHRGTARKRIVQVRAERPLAAGAAVTAGEATIGSIGSICGPKGLATVRLDRAHEAMVKGIPLMAGEAVVEIVLPAWANFELAPQPREAGL